MMYQWRIQGGIQGGSRGAKEHLFQRRPVTQKLVPLQNGSPRNGSPRNVRGRQIGPPEHPRQKNLSARDRPWHRTWSAPAIDGPPSKKRFFCLTWVCIPSRLSVLQFETLLTSTKSSRAASCAARLHFHIS